VKPQKSQKGGASTYGKSTTIGSIIISIRFGNLADICAKKQKKPFVETRLEDSSRKWN
jgi:hypothetical protein